MWVYFNDNGQVITSIPHGENIKQGGSFNVYVAFNKSYFQNLIGKESILYTSEELINWINANIGATFTFEDYADQYPFAELKKFEKIKDNESVCMLKDGENYVVFHYKGLPNETELYGDFTLVFRLANVTRETNSSNKNWEEVRSSVIEHEVYIQGPINVYIEATYGYKPISTNVSKEQIDILLDVIKEHAFNQKIFVRYSEYENGAEMVEYENEQEYFGLYVGLEPSSKPEDYVWIKRAGANIGEVLNFLLNEDGVLIITNKSGAVIPSYNEEEGIISIDNASFIGGVIF